MFSHLLLTLLSLTPPHPFTRRRLQDAEDLIRQFAFNRILARGPSRPGKPLPASPADVPVDLDSWFVEGAPWELSCAVAALRAGVKRAHLVDIRDRRGGVGYGVVVERAQTCTHMHR